MTVHPEWGLDQLGENNIVTVRMKNGAVHERTYFTAHGDPWSIPTRDEVVGRYRACAQGLNIRPGSGRSRRPVMRAGTCR